MFRVLDLLGPVCQRFQDFGPTGTTQINIFRILVLAPNNVFTEGLPPPRPLGKGCRAGGLQPPVPPCSIYEGLRLSNSPLLRTKHLGILILVPGSWDQNLGTGSLYQFVSCSKCSVFCPRSRVSAVPCRDRPLLSMLSSGLLRICATSNGLS